MQVVVGFAVVYEVVQVGDARLLTGFQFIHKHEGDPQPAIALEVKVAFRDPGDLIHDFAADFNISR